MTSVIRDRDGQAIPSLPGASMGGSSRDALPEDAVGVAATASHRPRVLYIHQHFKRPDEAGGSRPYEFATRLAARGWDVTVVCAGPGRRTYDTGGFRVIQLGVQYANEMSFSRRLLSFLRFSGAATLTAVTLRSDVVFASSTPLTVAVPALGAHVLRRRPMVFEVRDLWPEVPISLGALRNPLLIWAARLLARVTYRRSASVIGLSPTMCRGVREVSPVTDVRLIPNTAQPERFRVTERRRRTVRAELGVRDGDTLVVYAGSLGRTYNAGWLLRLGASPTARARCVKVLVIGKGAQYEELRALAEGLGLDSDRTVLGLLPKSRVAEVYAASDLVASCLVDEASLADNSLNKVFDAYAAGRPLIFNHRGWLAELTEQAGAGWRLSTDPDQAASQLCGLATSAELIAAGRRSAALGLAHFDVDRAARSLDEVLRQALDRGRRP